MRNRYQGFSTAVHSRCDKLYNDGMTPEEIQTLMAKEESQEEVVRKVVDDLGSGMFRASGMKKKVKEVMEAIRERVTRKRRNILKD